MKNEINIGGIAPETLINLADKLESAGTIAHGSAYVPMRAATLILRRLARDSKATESLTTDDLVKAAVDLRKFSSTVSQPATDRMKDAADLFEKLVQQNQENN